MSHRHRLSPLLLAGLGMAVLPAVARAQTIPPACRPPIEAEKKVLMTPNHAYTTERPARARTWVATGSGLVLRTEEDLDTGNGDTRHVSIRYEDANVRVPAGVR